MVGFLPARPTNNVLKHLYDVPSGLACTLLRWLVTVMPQVYFSLHVRTSIWLTCTRGVTRNLSGDEIANVNFLYDDIVHAVQNTIDSCINSATDRRGYALERRFTKFSEITQYNGLYAVQGHSKSPVLVLVESSYTTSY